MNEATKELKDYYEAFEKDFTAFFKELIEFSTKKRVEIEKQFNI